MIYRRDMRRFSLTVTVLTAALALLAGACGSDGDGPDRFTPGAADTGAPDDTADASDDTPAEDTAADGDATGVDRSSELVGRWNIINYTLPGGGGLTNWVGDRQPYIEFLADGTVEFDTGCNTGGGPYVPSGVYVEPESALDDVVKGQPITLGPGLFQTEIGCSGFLGEQDVDLPANFMKSTRFILGDGELLLLDEFILVQAVGV